MKTLRLTPEDPQLFHVVAAHGEAAAREALAAALKAEGYRVSPAESGEAAWALIERERPAAVIAPRRLPGLEPGALLARLAGAGLERVVAVLVLADPDDAATELLDAGAADVLRAGIAPEELRARVRAALRPVALARKFLQKHTELFRRLDALLVQDGGCAPGYDPVTAFLADELERLGLPVYVAAQGFRSLVSGRDDDFRRLVYQPAQYRMLENVPGVVFAGPLTDARGGSFRADRYPEFAQDERQREAAAHLTARGVKVLVGIGGNGTFLGLQSLVAKLGKEVQSFFIPVTIDSDLYGTECIGEHTGVEVGAEKLRGYMADARTHNRLYIIEMMGARSGFHALHSCLGARAHLAVLPSVELDLARVAERLGRRDYAVIAVAEGYGVETRKAEGFKGNAAEFFLAQLRAHGFESKRRVVCEGFSRDLRGAAPNNQDISLCQRMAKAVGRFVEGGQTRLMPTVNAGQDGSLPFHEIETDNTVSGKLGHLAQRLLG